MDTHASFILSAINESEDFQAGDGFSYVITSDELEARKVQNIIQAFYPGEVLNFPSREYNLTQIESSSKDAMHQRIRVLSKIINSDGEHKPIVVLAAPALQQRLINLDNLEDKFINLEFGAEYDPDKLIEDLTKLGYRATTVADSIGEFSRRGDIIDIVPIDRKMAQSIPEKERSKYYGIRISFWDIEIDQIRIYDLETQRQVESLESVQIPPAREVLISEEQTQELIEKIKNYREEHSKTMYANAAGRDAVEAFRLICNQDIEKLENDMGDEILDRWIPLISEQYSIFDLFKNYNARPFVFNLKRVQESLDSWQALKLTQIQQLLLQGKTTPLVEENIISRGEVLKQLDSQYKVTSFSLFDEAGNGFPSAQKFRFRSVDAQNFRGREEELYTILKERQTVSQKTYIFVQDQDKRNRLNENLLLNAPAAVERLVPSALNQGFEWPEAKLLVLGNENVFGQRYKSSKRRKKNENRIQLFSDLELGQFVVHETHGIGIYEGLETISTQGGTRDYIKVAYAKDDKLFLPMEAIEQLSKYIGMDARKPRLSRLGGSDWTKLKTRARDSIKKLATNLVELYAKRNKLKGYKFSPDTNWDREFAEDFEFEETQDQLTAMDEIREDMESDKVMDRLLVGDVGFGKTELAFRAMFKAVNNSQQAAMLAPTTVLAQQHYDNLVQRAKNYPITVEVLSRFVSPKKQKDILKRLANGDVDIVIGTHRILSKDINFKRLGVLVVDEEQRFGVDHKELLKERYPEVDVLSLSATPIPRTLHMSLAGIRDISTLEEAPQERREVQTYVMEHDTGILAEAITREVARGGQVFYLVNNISKMGEIASQIESAIPGVRTGIGHGQMPEGQLENVIRDFIDGDFDVLVCTTIIESGIDMPNVNTLIVTGAERFGLAQLYQIKGRVGRSNKQAYAYVTYDKNKSLNEDATKRLQTIRDNTALGSGMKIAMRDMEVRGAGNLLGGEQHGHMEAIGYELYVQMLEEEVKRVMEEQGMESDEATDIVEEAVSKEKLTEAQIDIKLDAYLPTSLISSEGQRMDIYKRLRDIDSKEDYDDILDELEDRYGEIPKETYTLADISYVQNRASHFGLNKIYIDKNNIQMDFPEDVRPNMEMLSALLNLDKYKKSIRFNAIGNGRITYAGAAKIKSQVATKLRELFSDLDEALKANRQT